MVKTLLLCSAVLPNARGKRQGQERREKARAEYDAPPCAHRGFASRPKVSVLYLFPFRRRWDLLGLTSTSGGYRPANFHLTILDFRPSKVTFVTFIFEGNEGGRMRVRSMPWWGSSRTRVTYIRPGRVKEKIKVMITGTVKQSNSQALWGSPLFTGGEQCVIQCGPTDALLGRS